MKYLDQRQFLETREGLICNRKTGCIHMKGRVGRMSGDFWYKRLRGSNQSGCAFLRSVSNGVIDFHILYMFSAFIMFLVNASRIVSLACRLCHSCTSALLLYACIPWFSYYFAMTLPRLPRDFRTTLPRLTDDKVL